MTVTLLLEPHEADHALKNKGCPCAVCHSVKFAFIATERTRLRIEIPPCEALSRRQEIRSAA